MNKTLKLKSLIPFADTHNAQQKLFFEIKAIGAAKDYFCNFYMLLSTPAIKQNALRETQKLNLSLFLISLILISYYI